MIYSTAMVELIDPEDADEVTQHFARDVSWKVGGGTLSWVASDSDEDVADKRTEFSAVTSDGLSHEFLADGKPVARVRALNPYDAVNRLDTPGVPQPLEVVQAEARMGGGMMAQDLTAVVAEDNTVVTLVLETPTDTYVRYSGDWQRLNPDSTVLEDTWVLESLAAEALEVFDAADMANTPLSAFDLPRRETTDKGESVDIVPDPVAPPVDESEAVTAAAGPIVPQVVSLDDLPMAIRYAHHTPSARWFVTKRAKALGAADLVPAEWSSPL